MASTDPREISTIAVTASDVVAAYEANRQRDAGAVLRVTPPFHGRMRARLHRTADATTGDDARADATPLTVSPERLLDADAPAYPHPDDTADALRAEQGEFSTDEHHERHVEAVEAWRSAATEHIADAVRVDTRFGTHEVAVAVLGGDAGSGSTRDED